MSRWSLCTQVIPFIARPKTRNGWVLEVFKEFLKNIFTPTR
jgi:hypothetical protein